MAFDIKRIVSYVLLLAGVTVLTIFLATTDLTQMERSIELIGFLPLLLVIAITILNISMKAVRWMVLIRESTQQRIGFGFAFASVIAGVSAGSLFPGRIELAKPLLLKSEKNIPLSKTLSVLVIERAFDLLCILLILLISWSVAPAAKGISTTTILSMVSVGTVILLVVFLSPKLGRIVLTRLLNTLPLNEKVKKKGKGFIDQSIENFKALRKGWLIFFLSAAANLLEILRFFFVLSFLGILSGFSLQSIAVTGLAFSAAILIGILAMIPGGIGVTELSASTILIVITGGADAIVRSAVLIDRIVSYYTLIVAGAVILAAYGKFSKKSIREKQSLLNKN